MVDLVTLCVYCSQAPSTADSPLVKGKSRRWHFLLRRKEFHQGLFRYLAMTNSSRTGMIGKRPSKTRSTTTNRHVTFFLTLVMVLVTAWLGLRFTGVDDSHTLSLLEETSETNLNVALVETGGSHEEVTAALFYAIASVPGVYTSMYLALPRFGIENVYAWIRRRYKLSPYSVSPLFLFQSKEISSPDLIVLTTCEHDVFAADTALDHHFETGSKQLSLVCVLHHVDRFRAIEPRLRRWARSNRLRFLLLSSHTAQALRNELTHFTQKIYSSVHVDEFPPIFPVPLNPNPASTDRLSIAIQGNFEDSRRDYLKTLLQFERMLEELPEPIVSRIQFILAGHGKEVGIPGKIMPYISVNFSLDFIPYYNLLHESFALIPAFADEGYYKTKASSSVAASFIANTPILGSDRLLESYSYLSKDSMWHEEEVAESEMTAIYELLRRHFDDYGIEKSSWKVAVSEKKQTLKTHALELMEKNARLMRQIILKKGS